MYDCTKSIIQQRSIIEFQNSIPIYIQIALDIKIQIFSGKIKPGEKLPSVRDFACKLKVNPNTMQRALAELEDEELIFTERTNGKYVTTDENLIMKYRKNYANELIKNYKDKLKEIGIKI